MACRKRHDRRGGFTLAELLAAMAFLSIALGGAAATLTGLSRLQALYEAESQAIAVLNNTVERLGAERQWDLPLAGRVLDDELDRSMLSRERGYAAAVRTEPGGAVRLAVLRPGDRPLAGVEVAP